MFFETLENRSLFSVSLSAGVLTITGTNLNDAITIDKNSSGQVAVKDDGVLHNYSWASVSKIVVNAGAPRAPRFSSAPPIFMKPFAISRKSVD